MPELVPVSDDEYESLMKIIRNWTLLALGAVFLMIIQLGIIPVAAFYYLKSRKLIKELRRRA